MAIFRQGRRPEDNFTQIANELAQDPNIPAAAKGVYLNMRSHRDGWAMTTERIGKANGMSKSTAAKYINVLIDAGYIVRNQVNENGRFGGVEYIILSTPRTKNWDTVPESENPQVVPRTKNPYDGKRERRYPSPHKKTNYKNTNNKKDKGGLEVVKEPETTGLEEAQEPAPKSLDDLAQEHASSDAPASPGICPQHPWGNSQNVPCAGCRDAREYREQAERQRELSRKGEVVRELRERNESYTPPAAPTVDKYPSGVAEVGCPRCGASSGEQCVRDGEPAMLPCGERLRAAKSSKQTP